MLRDSQGMAPAFFHGKGGNTMHKFKLAFLMTMAMAGVAAAQQPSVDLHADYARGTMTHSNSWGGGAALQLTFGGSTAPIQVNTSLAGDYLKQSQGGPGTAILGYDLTFQPGGNNAITPYAGAGASLNWSTGDNKSWEGAKAGYDAIGGLQLTFSFLPSIKWKVEERFGYINKEEHTLQTRAGILISM
jgi:hypothetical protein